MSASARAQENTPVAPVVTHNAVLRTSMGDIEIELYGLDAPKTVKNFIELAKKQYYNGILFHRVVPGFVIQAGDPYSRDSASRRDIWGTGGTSIFGSTFADELNASGPLAKLGYKEGVLAMANRGPNTNTSQFFIVLSEDRASHLPFSYTIFGRVTKGMEIIHKIERVELDPRYNGQPKQPVSILEVNAVEVKPTNR
jgi:cyclophilin family peptidyl-prolyl cis-trans isomerase